MLRYIEIILRNYATYLAVLPSQLLTSQQMCCWNGAVCAHSLGNNYSILCAERTLNQYTPPTPTRLNSTQLDSWVNCRVESRRPCERTRQQSWPSLQFPVLWAIEVDDKWRHNDVIVEKVINVDQNSRSQAAMKCLWSVFKLLSTESVDSRCERVANSVHTADADATRLDSW